MNVKFCMAMCLLQLINATVAIADDLETTLVAARIAAGIRQAGMQRVAVLPMLLEQEKPKLVSRGNSPFMEVQPGTRDELRASLHAQLYAEQMQTRLADMSGTSFRLVDSVELMDAVRATFPDLKQVRGTGKDLKPLSAAVDGGLQGLVVGTMRDRPLEVGRPSSGFDFGQSSSPFSVRDVTWKLIDLTDGTIAAARGQTGEYSLADDVYAGRSQEFFRWKDGRLWALGFGGGFPAVSQISLNPRDSLDLFRLQRNMSDQPHPIFNPHCPFKVKFTVDGHERSLTVPVAREAETVGFRSFNYEPLPSNLYGQPYGSRFGSGSNSAYLPLHPGEGLKIHVSNECPQPVMVAVFVDGINILGKKRELPDDTCRVWRFDSKKSGVFAGWFSGETGKEQVEPFVITPWEDSVAAKLGQTERVGTITLVFYTEGWPNRQLIAAPSRHYGFFACWDPRQKKLLFQEEMLPPLPPGVATAAPAGVDAFAMGGKKPQPHPLNYQKSQPQGTILAAMTVSYGTKADIPDVERERHQLTFAGYRANSSRNDELPYVFVEAPPNGLLPHQEAPITQAAAAQPIGGQPGNRTRFGAYIRNSRSGVQVTGVVANSPATRCQNGDGKNWFLEVGDVITHVNGQPVQTEAEYRAAVQESPASMQISVIGGRDRQRYEFTAQLNN